MSWSHLLWWSDDCVSPALLQHFPPPLHSRHQLFSNQKPPKSLCFCQKGCLFQILSARTYIELALCAASILGRTLVLCIYDQGWGRAQFVLYVDVWALCRHLSFMSSPEFCVDVIQGWNHHCIRSHFFTLSSSFAQEALQLRLSGIDFFVKQPVTIPWMLHQLWNRTLWLFILSRK